MTAPASIDDLLRRLVEIGGLTFVSIAPTRDGKRVQVSAKRPDGMAFKVAINEDPVAAFYEAVGPDHGHTWAERLKLDGDICECMGSGMSGPDQVCSICGGAGGTPAAKPKHKPDLSDIL